MNAGRYLSALQAFAPLVLATRKGGERILGNPGCPTHDIQFETWVSCPSGRITELRKKGVPIISYQAD